MSRLPVLSIFPTIQGEGCWTGTPAVFVRLAGCDVGCFWCDTRYSWDVPPDAYRPVDAVTEEILQYSPEVVVITGGEPSMHDLRSLTERLRPRKRIHIETAGTHPLQGVFDWITFSPKKFKPPHASVPQQAHELKIVVYNRHDLEWARQWREKVSPECACFLQPEWNRRREMMPHILDFIQQHPSWRLSVQVHKFLHLP